jgi:hypothetical protein
VRLLAIIGMITALGGTATQAAMLREIDNDPLTVRGVRFKPNERIKLVVAASSKGLTRTVRAGRRGGFVVSLDVTVDESRSAVVQAFGSRGSRASLHLDTVDRVLP